jgi:hypothetical protein
VTNQELAEKVAEYVRLFFLDKALMAAPIYISTMQLTCKLGELRADLEAEGIDVFQLTD